jgi:acylphosphatase
MTRRAHVWVSGRVQGVSFRAYTAREAATHHVHGWVRNGDDGRVEAVFEGPAEAVDALVSWCSRGSPAARVDRVDVTWEEPEHERGFVVRV